MGTASNTSSAERHTILILITKTKTLANSIFFLSPLNKQNRNLRDVSIILLNGTVYNSNVKIFSTGILFSGSDGDARAPQAGAPWRLSTQ